MSKLFISLLFLFLIGYSIVICYMYIHEWQEKCNLKRECIEQEHQIDMQIVQINKLKKQLAKMKQSLYNENKEDRNGRNKNHN